MLTAIIDTHLADPDPARVRGISDTSVKILDSPWLGLSGDELVALQTAHA